MSEPPSASPSPCGACRSLAVTIRQLRAELATVRRQLDDATGMTEHAVAADVEAGGRRHRAWRAANKLA